MTAQDPVGEAMEPGSIYSNTPMTCTKCGHVGKLFLPKDQAEAFSLQMNIAWFRKTGWKLVLVSILNGLWIGALLGRLLQ